MRIALISLAILTAGASKIVAQAAEAAQVRLVAADWLRQRELPKKLYAQRHVVLNFAPLGLALDDRDSIITDPSTPLSAQSLAGGVLATRVGLTLKTDADEIRCDHPHDCQPLNLVLIQIGEPRMAGNSARVIYRITWINGGPGFSAKEDHLHVLDLQRNAQGEWVGEAMHNVVNGNIERLVSMPVIKQ